MFFNKHLQHFAGEQVQIYDLHIKLVIHSYCHYSGGGGYF
jgi:hypothetical protein